MQLTIAKGMYRNKLPNIVVDQVYFESMREDGINRVSLDLLYQIPAGWATVSPYRVMLIMTDDDSVIHDFRQHPSTAKHAILDDTSQTPAYMKMYLMGDGSGEVSSFDEAMSLGKKSTSALMQRRVKVDLPDLPQDLWPNIFIYVVAYRVDTQDETPSGISQKLSTIRTGFPLSETIYIENRTAPLALVYRLASSAPNYGTKGDLWSGPIHRQGGRLMAGELHSDGPHPYLSITTVSNQKTQDKSFMKEQSRLFLGLTRASRTLNQRMTKNIEAARNLSGPGSNGISDIHFTRNTSGVLKAVFSINYKHFVQANTKMNFLFRNKTALNGCFEVENLRLFRTRIQSSVASNRLTPGVLNICGAGEQGTPKLVATLTNGNITGVGYQNQVASVTTYVGTDIEMAGIEGGSYEYTLYIDGVDNSGAAVNHVLGLLKTALTAYDGWISQNFYGQHGALNTDAPRRIRSQSQFLQQDGSWPKLIDTYLAAVMFIFGADAFQEYSMVSWRKNLLAMCNPRNGDLESMHEVGELVRNFYTSLDQAANPPTTGANSNTFSVRSKISTTSTAARRISLLNVFPSPYNHRFDPATGFDFLDDELVNDSPTLTGFSYTNYFVRMNNEIGKYNISPEGTNWAGYLTPARIRTPTNIINTTTMAIGLNNTIDLLAAKARPQMPKLSFHTSTPANTPSGASIDELLSMGGLTVQPLVLDIQSIRGLPTPTAAQAAALSLVSSTDYLSSGSAFVQDDAPQLAATSGSAEQNILYSHEEINDSTVSIRHSGLVMTMINSQLGGFSQFPPEHYTDGIAGSLAAKALSSNPLLLLENNTATIAISFNSIKEVQYFQGFETNSRGDALIDAPIWRILTEDMYNQANSQGARLLCRTQDTPDVTSGGNILELGEYDNLFILGDATSAATTRFFMPYTFYYATIMQQLESTVKQTAINIKTPLSNVKPFLIRLPLMAATRISDKGIVSTEENPT
tara:strand:+ start:288 stop:3206 length:2919 start_codon:yes stop_codon:yes gene_type:complete